MTGSFERRHHGLPGAPFFKGADGADGAAGGNVYFGYVSDFFNYTEMKVDNFVRFAQKGKAADRTSPDPDGYYTGVFRRLAGGALSDQPELDPSDPGGGDTNVFRRIYSNDYFDRYYYSYRGDNSSKTYVSVDVGALGRGTDGKPSPWNVSSAKWELLDAYQPSFGHETYYPSSSVLLESWWTEPSVPYRVGFPYEEFRGSSPSDNSANTSWWTDFVPFVPRASRLGDFELFTVLENGKYRTVADVSGEEKLRDRRYVFDPALGTDQFGDSPASMEKLSEVWSGGEGSVGGEGKAWSLPADYVKYDRKLVETVKYPDRLRPDIKAGDVLYFWTDEDAFELDHEVRYMAVVTKELEGCTADELETAAAIVDPFSFKFVATEPSGSGDYLSTRSPAVSAAYSSGGIGGAETNGRNFANLLSASSDAPLALGAMTASGGRNELACFAAVPDAGTPAALSLASEQNAAGKAVSSVSVGALSGEPSQAPLKISGLLAKTLNVGNLETVGCLEPPSLRLDSGGYVRTLGEGDFDSAAGAFRFSKSSLVADSELDDCSWGALVLSRSTGAAGGEWERSRKLSFSGTDAEIPLAPDFGDGTEHAVFLRVCRPGGIPRFSRGAVARWSESAGAFAISRWGDDAPDGSAADDGSGTTAFEFSGISAEGTAGTPARLLVTVPEDARNVELRVNGRLVSASAGYSNSWCSVGPFAISSEGGKVTYSMDVEMTDNIPQIVETDAKTAADYYASPGTSDETDGCDLFNALLSGRTISTVARSAVASASYSLGSRNVRSSFRMEQPGLADTRKAPRLKLSLRDDPDYLERCNSFSNGVLCGQFRFFVDVDVEDFSRDDWGAYVPEGDVTLNFDVSSVPVDYEYARRYAIQSSESTYSVHAFSPSPDDYENNYCSVRTFVLGPDAEDPAECSARSLSESAAAFSESNPGSGASDSFLTNAHGSYRTAPPLNRIPMSGGMFPSERKRGSDGLLSVDADALGGYGRASGISDAITASFRGVTFSQAAGKLRVGVSVEFGNPVFSYLFFRFYVSNLWVSYRKPDGTESRFYYGTSNLAYAEDGNYQLYDYAFSTSTFRAFVCPVSLTAAPESLAPDECVPTMGVMMRGSDAQVSVETSRYVPDLASFPEYAGKTDDQKRDGAIAGQEVPWYQFRLKRRYFQDNVETARIALEEPSALDGKLPADDPFAASGDASALSGGSAERRYLCLEYASELYRRAKRSDKWTFYYNGELLDASRYDQKERRAPAFVSPDVERAVRSAALADAVAAWNLEYQASGRSDSGAFAGHAAVYGNGYEYLPDSADSGQYSASGTLSLAEAKRLSEEDPQPRSVLSEAVSASQSDKRSRPRYGGWFSDLLLQAEWRYPLEKTGPDQAETVDALPLASPADYYDGFGKPAPKDGAARVLPYQPFFSMYPRVARNDEDGYTVVFMLRRPSVRRENQYFLRADDLCFDADLSDADAALPGGGFGLSPES